MRRKVFSALMCAAMVTSLFAGCGSSDASTTASNSGSTTGDGTEAAAEDAVEDATESAESEVVTNTFGDPNGTHLEMWTFVELHGQHYGKFRSLSKIMCPLLWLQQPTLTATPIVDG